MYNTLCVVGGNTKREQGRKVQESNVAAAKVSDNMVIVYQMTCVFLFSLKILVFKV